MSVQSLHAGKWEEDGSHKKDMYSTKVSSGNKYTMFINIHKLCMRIDFYGPMTRNIVKILPLQYLLQKYI